MKKFWPNETGPMLAENYDEVEVIVWPMMGQPKLNGIRACWDGAHLISRQRHVWKRETLPNVYAKLEDFSVNNPGICLDGELYAHGLRFQDIEAITSINRINPHPDHARIDFHAFDIISDLDTEARQITLSQIYKPWVAVCKVTSPKDADVWLNRFIEAGFEGMMLRQYSCPYIGNRTEALIKLKPWKFIHGLVKGFTPGKGKYEGQLGALIVALSNGQSVKVSGGLSDGQRQTLPDIITRFNALMVPIPIVVKYRELSKVGVPLQPQVVNLKTIAL